MGMGSYQSPEMQKSAMIAGGAGGLGQGLFNLLMAKNPIHAANKYLEQIPGQVAPYYNPYLEAGQSAVPQLSQQFGQLAQNPAQRLNEIGSHYQESPGYQFSRDQALRAISNAQAAGGMSGTPQHQTYAAERATQLANQDYYNYLQQALGLYNTGLGGLGTLGQQGLMAGSDFSHILADMLGTQAGLGYYGANYQNQSQGSGLGGLLGGIASIGSALKFL